MFRDIVLFFAGFEFFHTLAHVFFAFLVPLDLKFIILTPTLNTWSIVINALITLALLWWAKRLRSK
ncbi:TPA: hypothetical protein I8Y83_002736 [Legionella pneumophila]|uniref:Uncharacterized protein n=2 Tax=Legionella TaxID=445 RepID=A0A378P9V6_9GAMM|nr:MULTISPECIES: hypothetical protein [Legionella]HAT1722187.1 hypothetical protein [Legionella pneumophila]KTC69588.1 hypothetical protein Lboz_3104 [Legionella bozemanae]KTD53863.1 hypothetical protein Lqua_0302 [Legionella quateirensis]STP13867.1 Uncharacterised protein [Legionella bozemanae]STY82930.1 Uncharacterised protein [Legionella quateirensis]